METLSPHLTICGGVRKSSMKEVVDMMRKVDGKLVPKCLFINIISASDEVVQFRLCRTGAWDILCDWLQVAQKNENTSLLKELLTLYRLLPVTVELLTTNNCPKAIKSLSKHEESDINKVANDIIKKWKRVVQITNQNSSEAVDSTPPTKKRKLDNEPSNEIEMAKSESFDMALTKSELADPSSKKKSTVKIPPTKMRTAGLEDANESLALKSRFEVLAKKDLSAKKKSESVTNGLIEIPLESFHQKITIEKRRASHDIHESSGFMDALTSSQPVLRKKKKTSKDGQNSKNTRKDSTELSSPSATTPDAQSNTEGLGPKKSSMADMSEHNIGATKKQKRVSWATEDDLQSIFFFELDETERVNVNRVSMEEMKKKEHLSERQMFAGCKRSTDVETKDAYTLPSIKWCQPPALENVPATELQGANSQERETQAEREKKVLQVIYFTKESIPESSAEPDPENFEAKEPFLIPTEDISNPVAQNDGEDVLKSDDGGTLSDELLIITQKEKDGGTKVSLNPQLADLVKSMAANLCKDNHSTPETNPASELENEKNTRKDQNPQIMPPSSPDDKIRSELWEIISINYPDLNLEELNVERVRELLEPLKDQLVARKIFNLPHNFSEPPPPFGYRPHMGHGGLRRPMLPGGQQMMPPVFNRGGGGSNYRMQPPGMMQGPLSGNHYGPRRPLGPPAMPTNNSGGPMFRQPSAYVCRFYQMGNCRHGANCIYLHPGVNGPGPRMAPSGPPLSQRAQGHVGGRPPFSNGMYK